MKKREGLYRSPWRAIVAAFGAVLISLWLGRVAAAIALGECRYWTTSGWGGIATFLPWDEFYAQCSGGGYCVSAWNCFYDAAIPNCPNGAAMTHKRRVNATLIGTCEAGGNTYQCNYCPQRLVCAEVHAFPTSGCLTACNSSYWVGAAGNRCNYTD